MKKSSRTTKFLWAIATIALICVFCWWQNNDIVVSDYVYEHARVPAGFDGYKIVQISDLHNKEFGAEQGRLLSAVDALAPDIIVITGDLIDRRKLDLDVAMSFVAGAVEIAPVYYVSGNHEAWSGEYERITRELSEAGVVVMDDAAAQLTRGESSLQLLGLSDPNLGAAAGWNLAELAAGDSFKILLTHRPERFARYREHNIDLVFAGHAHGGQIRLPLIGGLFAPQQGWFPKYIDGSYTEGSSTMFVSRGLGNSVIPLRIFNRPQIVAVTLKSEQAAP